jgi:AraC-like DNA-binding protein
MLFMLEKKEYSYEARRGGNLSPTPHLHTHIELVLVKEGLTRAMADDRECDVAAGDLFIAFPNQIHYYLDKTPRVPHEIPIISPEICPEFNRIFKTMCPTSPLLQRAAENTHIAHAIDGIIGIHERGGDFADSEARGYLLVLFSELFRAMPLVENGSCETDIMKNIIHFCYEHYDTDISLQTISDALHISRYTVSHLFSKKLHTGFNDYINSLRISRACELLGSGDTPITEIAYAVGYNAIRSFNRCFQDIMHMTPKEYRRRRHDKKDAKN